MSETHSTKHCAQCGQEKPLTDFYEQAAGKYGRTSRCVVCVRANHKARRDRVDPPHLKPLYVRRELERQGLKKCNGCGEVKAIGEFRKARRPDGYIPGPLCKPCDVDRCRRWVNGNREKRQSQQREYRSDPGVRGRRREYKRQRNAASPRWLLQTTLRHALKRRPTEDGATNGDVWEMWQKQGGRCAITGIPMTWAQGKVTPTSISIDRIDPDIGYTRANIRMICHCVNAFRGRMTDAEMLDMAKAIVANLDRPAPAAGLLSLVA